MDTISISVTSMEDAERQLARIWRELEEQGLATPRLSVLTHTNGQLDLKLAFRNAGDANAVRLALRVSGSATTATHYAIAHDGPD